MAIVGIVEDNIKIRDLIQRYLDMQEDMSCPVAKDSVEEMLEYLEKHQAPNVLLMDIQLPGMTGIKGMEIIKSKYPDIDIIMLTVYHDSHKIFDSLKAGASGLSFVKAITLLQSTFLLPLISLGIPNLGYSLKSNLISGNASFIAFC